MRKLKPLHFNRPQIESMLIDAYETYHVWSRGTGKSSGVISPWFLRRAQEMPRSMGGIVGSTFQQVLVRTLPPAISNWERMGYHQNVHFIIGKEPDAKWKKMWGWEGPLVKPLDSKYCIYWYNSSVQVLISQDRIGSANGLSLQYLGGDEAKLLNKERLDDEILPTLRGSRSHFGHLPGYGSKLFTTDMPTNPKSKWILDKVFEMDEDQIELILLLSLRIHELEFQKMNASKPYSLRLQTKINTYKAELNKLRKGSVFYSEANALDNLDVLGEDYIKDMKRNLTDLRFRISIMNERNVKVEGGFYPLLDEETHGQEWFNNDFLDQFVTNPTSPELKKDQWRQDEGMDISRPLEVSFDYGAHINTMVVCQELGEEFRLLNGLYVLHPQLVSDLVNKFCDYYQSYPKKEVVYWYDHTAVGNSGVTSYTYSQIVKETFDKRGWFVYDQYCGQAPTHDRKYDFWNVFLSGQDRSLPNFKYSITRAEKVIGSMNNSKVKQGTKGFEKDKSDERNPSVKQEDAPHFSDALDTIAFFKYIGRLEHTDSFIPLSTS